jgi:hypothetical protein
MIRYTLGNKRTLGAIGASLLVLASLPAASAEVPEIEQLAPVEQPDAFRQAMILLGH